MDCRCGKLCRLLPSVQMMRKAAKSPEKSRTKYGMGLATSLAEQKHSDHAVSLNGIAGTAISALKTNSAALGVVANNVSNLNTAGYARRVVNQQTLSVGGQLMGVNIASVQRVASQFLMQEMLSAGGANAQYSTMGSLFSQLNGLLGAPGDNQSLATGLTNLSAAFATASQAPTSSASRTAVMNALNNLAGNFSSVFSTISQMQGQTDQQVVGAISSTNILLKQVFELNQQIRNATVNGDTASGLLDQRDTALGTLSETLGIRTTQQPDGSVIVATADGVNLVSNTYAQLSYTGGAQNGSYGNITVQDINPATGAALGAPQALDPHLASGSLKGLIDMRDQVLGGLSQTLGNLAQQTAQAFNAQANANAAFPPPTSLSGRNTGLLGGDALNFTGKTTIAVTGQDGTLVSRIDVNFGPPSFLSVDGGAPVSAGGTVGGFAAALNTALGGNGSASFVDGKLSISASGGNGIIVQDDATTPSSRGGAGFSQFFGLNDVFQSQMPSVTATGLSAGDASGLAAGGKITLQLKGPDGDIVRNVSITTTTGQTVGDIVTALNTALGGSASLTLNADGSITSQNSALYSDYTLNVTNDTTARGTTGQSFSQIFGLGASAQAMQAQGFSVTPAVTANPARIGFATPAITATSVAGDTILSGGDNSGAIALQNLITKSMTFKSAGGVAGQVSTLSDYAATFYQNVSTRSNAVTAAQVTQSDRYAEAQSRLTSHTGVSLDEELMALTSYQQAYAAGARILTMVDKMYQTLLELP